MAPEKVFQSRRLAISAIFATSEPCKNVVMVEKRNKEKVGRDSDRLLQAIAVATAQCILWLVWSSV